MQLVKEDGDRMELQVRSRERNGNEGGALEI